MIYKIKTYSDGYEVEEFKGYVMPEEICINTKLIQTIAPVLILDNPIDNSIMSGLLINGIIYPITFCYNNSHYVTKNKNKAYKEYHKRTVHADAHLQETYNEITSIMEQEAKEQ